ncbi:MAG: thioredoxin domain-containing protein [Acidobacteriota bacterium]
MRHLSLPLAALAIASIAVLPQPAMAGPSCAVHAGERVVATIDGEPIHRSALDAEVAEQLVQLDVQRQQILEAGLDQLIDTRLIEQAADQRSTSADALIDAELAAADPVSDDDVEAFYTANKARIQQPKEQALPRLREYLEQQRTGEARQRLLTELRAEHRVERRLDPLRLDLKPGKAPFRGKADAPVDVTIFSDFQCPFCARIEPTLDEVREHYGERVRVTFRQFPLTNIHPEAFQAAEASLCAQDQGKFWEMHAALFTNTKTLDRESLSRYADDLDLDLAVFDACVDSGFHRETVEADIAAGRQAGVGGTPTLFVNGRPVTLRRGADPFTVLSTMIDDERRRGSAETAEQTRERTSK